jgi:hypothetical protein
MSDDASDITATNRPRLSRRGALSVAGTGAVSAAGCLRGDGSMPDGPANRNTAGSTGAPSSGGAAAQEDPFRTVESATGMNEALRNLPENGGTIRWKPGSYTGEAFTEMVEIPTVEAFESPYTTVTLDMRSVHVKIRSGDPYRGEDGAFFYKPAGDRSYSLNVLGPHRLHVGGGLDEVNPTGGNIAADEGDEDDPFQDEDPAPHAFYLYDTEGCRIAPGVTGPGLDRILYFRQNGDCGHHVHTQGFRCWGGNVGIQIGDDRDDCGKDRCHWFGQIGGFKSAATHLENGLNNRIWAQFENPHSDHDEHFAGHRVRNKQNALMLIHIKNEGHGLDIQASNVGIFNSGTPGNPQSFHHNRMGIRPSNVFMPNYTATVFDFGTDYRSLFSTVEQGNGTVGYDGREGEVTLQAGQNGRAALQTTGPVGRMGHHLHGYVDARVVGQSAGKAPAVFRFGAWADADNYAMLTYDPTGDVPLGATICSGGEHVDTAENVLTENASVDGTVAPKSWIAYVRHDYQAFFRDYELVYEGYHDLTGWPQDPALRADTRGTDGSGATARLRRLEYGDARKNEFAEMLGAVEKDGTIERPWRVDDPSTW